MSKIKICYGCHYATKGKKLWRWVAYYQNGRTLAYSRMSGFSSEALCLKSVHDLQVGQINIVKSNSLS